PLSFGEPPVEVLRVRAARRSYWRAIVLSDFDGLRFLQAPQPIVASRENGGVVRLAGPVFGAPLQASVQVEAAVDSFLVAPGQPVGFRLPAEAGAGDLSSGGSAPLRSDPAP